MLQYSLGDFIERSLYYWSGNYYNDLKAGENYKVAKKTIAINILRQLLKIGMPIKHIIEITELSEEEIEKLK